MKTRLIIAAVCALPLLAIDAPAFAASAHNQQHGTSTKNSYDSPMSARMKQHHMRRYMPYRHMRHRHMRRMHTM